MMFIRCHVVAYRQSLEKNSICHAAGALTRLCKQTGQSPFLWERRRCGFMVLVPTCDFLGRSGVG